jgi:hypothetical protein
VSGWRRCGFTNDREILTAQIAEAGCNSRVVAAEFE